MFSAISAVTIVAGFSAISAHWIPCVAKIASVLFFLAVHSVV